MHAWYVWYACGWYARYACGYACGYACYAWCLCLVRLVRQVRLWLVRRVRLVRLWLVHLVWHACAWCAWNARLVRLERTGTPVACQCLARLVHLVNMFVRSVGALGTHSLLFLVSCFLLPGFNFRPSGENVVFKFWYVFWYARDTPVAGISSNNVSDMGVLDDSSI